MALLLEAKKGDIAEKVIVVGNLNRLEIVKSMLTSPRLVNQAFGFTAYTGKYKDEDLTVIFHGIGIPSLALVTEELYNLGAKYLIRFGSCSSIKPDIPPASYIIPTGYSYNIGGYLYQYTGELVSLAAVPDFKLVRAIAENLEKNNLEYYAGPVFTSDSIYTHNQAFSKKWADRNHIAVELEGAALLLTSMLKGIHAASLHVAYANLYTGETADYNKIVERERIVGKILIDTLVEMR